MVYHLHTDSVCQHQLTPRKRAPLDELIDVFPCVHATQWIITVFSSPPLDPILRHINLAHSLTVAYSFPKNPSKVRGPKRRFVAYYSAGVVCYFRDLPSLSTSPHCGHELRHVVELQPGSQPKHSLHLRTVGGTQLVNTAPRIQYPIYRWPQRSPSCPCRTWGRAMP
jgi:hypothetical protein